MKTMIKRILLIVLTLIFIQSLNVNAQTIERKVISSGGINYQSANLNVTSTIGETFITTIGNSGLILTQGFQQPVPYSCPFVLNNGNDTIAACGTSYTLDAGAGYSSYSWSNGSTNQTATVNETGWYKCTVTQGLCTSSDSVYLLMYNTNITINDTSVCSGSNLLMSVQTGLLPSATNGTNVNSLSFTSGQYARIPYSPSFDNLNALTIEFWYYQQSSGEEFVVATEYFNTGWGFHNENPNVMQWRVENGPYSLGGNNYGIPTNQWIHVAGVYNGSTLSLYINGNLIASTPFSGPLADSRNDDIVINRHVWATGSSSRLTGQIDELRFSKIARYSGNFTPPMFEFISDSNTVGLWHFNEGSGSQIIDASGNGHSGSLNGCGFSSNRPFTNYTSLNGTISYLWSNAATTPSISITPTQTTTYYCTVSNGISSCTDSVTVTVNNLNANLFAQDTIAACGTSYTLDAGAGYSSYSWSNGSSGQTATVNATGWYKCTVTQGSCSATDSVFVSLVDGNILNNDTIICNGSTVLLKSALANNQDSVLIDQFTMTVSSYYSHLSPILQTGKTYRLIVNGRYGFADGWSHNDAVWNYAWDIATQTKVHCNGTQDAQEDIRWIYNNLGNFQRPDNDIDNNSSFCSGIDKTYYWTLLGNNQQSHFEWIDGAYGDNSGSLNFKIYELTSNNNSNILWSTGATTASINVNPTQTTTYYCTVSNGISSCTDSVTITVNPTSTSTTTAAACDAYQWNGNTYTTSGTYTYTTTNAVGCDSVATLNLTITPSSTNTTSVTSCGSYTWSIDGQTYSQSGTYSSLSNCHTEILNLTVLPVPSMPVLACYQTANFNNTTCTWDITGNQPAQPILACYETATFNNTTCVWEVTGSQPTQPALACYQTASFNNATCSWDITGSQPAQPTLACYQTATFNNTTCSWDIIGTQPSQPTLACYETANFNTTTCTWDVTGTQPAQPTLACWANAAFNNTTCTWDITGNQPAQPILACYETATFNNTTCVWDVTGTMPTTPTVVCYETANFNAISCSWDITGTQPTQPTLACYETATFNNTTCVWDVTGTMPTTPTLACYETATFNTSTCQWDVTGSSAAPIITTDNGCDSYTWSVNGQVYTQSGTYNYTANCQDYTLNLTITNSTVYYQDQDFDGNGNANSTINSCNGVPSGYVAISGDCNDNNANINPGATEICGNGIDDNCDGNIDEGCACINPPTAFAGADTAICAGSNIQLYGSIGGGASNAIWTTSGSGVFMPSANLLNAMYVPSATDISSGAVTLTLTTNAVAPCNAAISAMVLTLNPVPAGLGPITGPTDICYPLNNIFTYSVMPIPGASTYTWTVPSGTVIQGSATGSTIQVKFINDNVHLSILGNITVTAGNSYGCVSAPSSLALQVQITAPIQPSSISGPVSACTGDIAVYSVSPVFRAMTYNWTLPTGATIIGGGSTNIITVEYNAAFTGGNISVSASNVCGTGATRLRTVSRNILPAPSTIIGPVDGLCNAINVTYSVTPVNGASSYNWTLPIGFTITSGAGTNSITVDVSSSFTTGSVAVAAVNACGAGLARSITVKAVPGIPAAISGPATSCVSSVQNYSTQPVIGAVSYTWTVPGGAVINNGQGTKNIDITYGSVASSTGIITVKASNTCGISNVRVLSVKTTNCPRAGSTSGLIINLNPNPTSGILNIESNELIKRIELFDMLGKLVMTYGNEKQIDISNLQSGLYLIRFTSENGVEQRRVEVSR